MQFFKETNIKFIEKRKFAFVISIVLILLAVYSIFIKKPNWGIEFVGGSLVEIAPSQRISISQLRKILDKNGLQGFSIQSFANSNNFIIRVKKEPQLHTALGIADKLQDIFKKDLSQVNINIQRVEMIGPVVGRFLKSRAYKAFFWAFLGMIIYIAWRFKGGVWGIAAVVALVHDVFITFGVITLLQKEITLPIVAALLTLAGYSINDTIVVYDRIREYIKILYKKPLIEIINLSINKTLIRTVNTSLTTLLVVLALFFKGGTVIHDFSLTLLIGIIIGTYSSVFIASPIVYAWENRKKQR